MAASHNQNLICTPPKTNSSGAKGRYCGRAAKIIQDAEAYREQTVAEAKGQSSRFSQVYEQYKKAPDVTRQRIYLETMERVLGGTDKTIIDTGKAGPGVLPYLPLSSLPQDRSAPAPQSPSASTSTSTAQPGGNP